METYEYVTLSRVEDTHAWHAGLKELALQMLSRHVSPGPFATVLDMGCGAGGTLALLAGRLKETRFYGLDRHPLAISLTGSRRTGATLVQGSANELPFGDESFDILFSLDVFYHREVEEERALREALRVLKKDGCILLNLPALEGLRGEHDRAVHTRHRYTAGEVKERLRRAGFLVRRLTYWNFFLLPVLFAIRKLKGRANGKGVSHSDSRPLFGPVNAVLKILLQLERGLISFTDLPMGSSVFALAQKCKEGQATFSVPALS